MSSAGQAIGGVVGAVVGFFTPLGPVYGAQIGMMVGGVLDPPRTEGPRLEDLTAQTSVYGAFIPRLYGTTAVVGNVLWIQGDKLIEHSVESDGKGGPVVTNFEYYATFAVGLCEGPIDGVRRIWIGGQLWYDAGSDDLSTIIASNEAAGTFTLYTGTDTQLADPLIQADRGAANVPAHRGLAYIVFDELPLKDYGNSLVGAQVKVEVVKDGVFAVPRLLGDFSIDGYPLQYGPRPAQAVIDGVIKMYAYDNTDGTSLVDGVRAANDETILAIDYAGNYIGAEPVTDAVVRPQLVSSTFETIQIGVLGGSQVWWTEYSSAVSYPIQNGIRETLPYGVIGGRTTVGAYGSKGDIGDYLTGEAGRYVKGVATSSDESLVLILTGASPLSASTAADKYFILDAELSVIKTGNTSSSVLGVWNIGTSVTQTEGGTVFDASTMSGWTSNPVSLNSIRTRYFYIDQSDVLQIGNEITSALSSLGYLAVAYKDGILYVIARTPTVARIYQYTAFPTITDATAPLSTIVESECLQSGLLTAGDLDVTELTDQVRGYRISNLAPLRGGLDQLRKAWPFDAIQHGYQIKFKKRGGASVATITEGELDARAAGANPGVRISNVREMDLIMPQQLTVQYMDATREYDVNVAEESR